MFRLSITIGDAKASIPSFSKALLGVLTDREMVCAQYVSVLLAMHVHEQLDLTISANSRVIFLRAPLSTLVTLRQAHAANCNEQVFNATLSSRNIAIPLFLYPML